MRISPSEISPSQDYLKPHTVAYILECITHGELDRLPPDPIVRRDESAHLVAIDGHNLIAVRLYRGEDVEVHLAISEDDGLPPTSEANIQRNRDLKEKYLRVLAERDRIRQEGIGTFMDLVHRYSSLFDQH